MTIINVTCPVCQQILKTSKGEREFRLSDHIEIVHPVLYDEMHVLAMEIKRLKEFIHEKTGCYSPDVFAPKRGR